MEKLQIDFDNYTVEELENLIEEIKRQLEIFKNSRSAVSKEMEINRELMECPSCHGKHINKDGHDKRTGIQMYECKDCKKKFSALSNTVFSSTHFSYEQIITIIDCMNDKLSIRKTADKVKVNKNTIFVARHKILDVLATIRENIKLTGDIEADEVYFSINLKGTKTENMPRFSKPRQSNGTTKQGISSHKVCVISAIDEMDNGFLEIAGNGPVTSNMISNCLEPKMNKVKALITDCKSSYESIAHNNSWNLVQIKSTAHVDEFGNSLANINSYHSGLENFLCKFRGVSTKHLQHYLDWYMFSKFLNYTVETLNQPKKFLKSIIKKSTNVIYKNVSDNTSGIDFDEVYADYA